MSSENESVRPSRVALQEALLLSGEILRDLELGVVPLATLALRASRLARLVNDFDMQDVLQLEVGGYPRNDARAYELAVKAKRQFKHYDTETKSELNFVYLEAIEALELTLRNSDAALRAAEDPNVSISSANPNQTVWSPMGNALERRKIQQDASRAAQRLAQRRALVYEFVMRRHYELKFSDIADDIFSRVRERVDSTIGTVVPEAVKKLASAYENLRSDNPEDWANAVHSCRRLLQAVADVIYPPTEDKTITKDGKPRVIKMGPDAYKNRIIQFVLEHSSSERFQEIVGSQLDFLGDRLDSVFLAAQKGSHAEVSKEEADRYVIYTYLLVGDVLSLISLSDAASAQPGKGAA